MLTQPSELELVKEQLKEMKEIMKDLKTESKALKNRERVVATMFAWQTSATPPVQRTHFARTYFASVQLKHFTIYYLINARSCSME